MRFMSKYLDMCRRNEFQALMTDINNSFDSFIQSGHADEVLFLLKERQIMKDMSENKFNFEYIRLATHLLRCCVKIEKSRMDAPLSKELQKRYSDIKDVNSHNAKLNYALMIFVHDVLRGNGKTAKENLLCRITDLNTNSFVQNNDQLRMYLNIIKSLFTLTETVDILIENVFRGSFWQKEIMVQKANFLWVSNILWVCFGVDMEFLRLRDVWLDLFRKAIAKNKTELVFFMHFPLSHVFLNLMNTQEGMRQFNADVEIPLSAYIREKVIPEYGLKPVEKMKDCSGKKRIAFVPDRVVKNAPFKLLYSLLYELRKQTDHELFVYDLETIEKSPSDPEMIRIIEELGVKYVSNHRIITDSGSGHYYSHFNKAVKLRERIVADGIDILVSMNNREQYNLLLASRTAPLQIYWCHGNFEFDIDGMDRRITHIPQGLMQENQLEYERFRLRQHMLFMEADIRAAKIQADIIRGNYPQGKVILGSIGRLIKLEGDGCIEKTAEIMLKNPDTIYLACGHGESAKIVAKAKEYGLENRFFFTSWVDPQIYCHVIDVYMNTFPNPSGESMSEYLYYNNNIGAVTDISDLTAYSETAGFLIALTKKIGRENLRMRFKLSENDEERFNLQADSANPVWNSLKTRADEMRKTLPVGKMTVGCVLLSENIPDFLPRLVEETMKKTQLCRFVFIIPHYLKDYEADIRGRFVDGVSLFTEDDPFVANFLLDIYLDGNSASRMFRVEPGGNVKSAVCLSDGKSVDKYSDLVIKSVVHLKYNYSEVTCGDFFRKSERTDNMGISVYLKKDSSFRSIAGEFFKAHPAAVLNISRDALDAEQELISALPESQVRIYDFAEDAKYSSDILIYDDVETVNKSNVAMHNICRVYLWAHREKTFSEALSLEYFQRDAELVKTLLHIEKLPDDNFEIYRALYGDCFRDDDELKKYFYRTATGLDYLINQLGYEIDNPELCWRKKIYRRLLDVYRRPAEYKDAKGQFDCILR